MAKFELRGFKLPYDFGSGGYLPFVDGSLVVYGQNGAGKSLVLEHIESALTGCVIGRTKAWNFENWMDIPAAAILRAEPFPLSKYGGSISDPSLYSLRDALKDFKSSTIEQHIPELEKPWRRLVGAVAAADHAVVVPTPSAEDGWVAFVAMNPDNLAAQQWHEAVHGYVRERCGKDGGSMDFDDAYDSLWEYSAARDEVVDNVVDLTGSETGAGIYRFCRASLPIKFSPFGKLITDARANPQDAIDEVWEVLRVRFDDDYLLASSPPKPSAFSNSIEVFRAVAQRWTLDANELLTSFMVDPPAVRIDVGSPFDWVARQGPRWVTGEGRPISSLSSAERRWARLAICASSPDSIDEQYYEGSMAAGAADSYGRQDSPILLIDEPERGLHRSAEAHMASALAALTRTGRLRLIAATHSPHLLDIGVGQLIHLKKRPDHAIGWPSALTQDDLDEAAEVGLLPSSLLRKDRGYLLVEGAHDQEILEGWFGKDLRRLRVEVLAMRGSKNLINVFDSEFLIRRSEALLMPLLDDVELEPLFKIWSSAEARVLDGRRSDAVGIIRRGLAHLSAAGARAYEPLLTGTVERGSSSRFFPLGMSKKDVLEYLPVDQVVPGAHSWGALWSEWMRSPAAMAARSSQRGMGKAYKDWLRQTKRADLSPENLRLVAETTQPHPELKAIIAKIGERLDRPQPTSAEL